MSKVKYAIRAWIIRQGESMYVARAMIECVDGHPAPDLDKLEPCPPCSYPQARTAAYAYIAHLSYGIWKAGGDLIEVTIWDSPPASTQHLATGL